MPQITFSTGNTQKFDIARAACAELGLDLVQNTYDIDEIQGEDPEVIIRDKAQKAFELVGGPVIVSDDSWNIPGLNGFPGAYMKSMDHWFRPEDFLNLTRPLTDRRIILIQMLAYQDAERYQVFRMEHVGELLPEIRGTHGKPLQKVVSMPGDNGLSIAEAYEQGTVHAERDTAAGWRELVAWYQQTILQTA
jgi:inosine/xanthosine triphosphate pyrophosphatase family protein